MNHLKSDWTGWVGKKDYCGAFYDEQICVNLRQVPLGIYSELRLRSGMAVLVGIDTWNFYLKFETAVGVDVRLSATYVYQ